MIPAEDRRQLQRMAEGAAASARFGVSAKAYGEAMAKASRAAEVGFEEAMANLQANAGTCTGAARRLVEAFSPPDSVIRWERRCRESLLRAHAQRAAQRTERERRRRLLRAMALGAGAWLFLIGVAALLEWLPTP